MRAAFRASRPAFPGWNEFRRVLSNAQKNPQKKMFLEHSGKQKIRPEFFPAAQEKPLNSVQAGK